MTYFPEYMHLEINIESSVGDVDSRLTREFAEKRFQCLKRLIGTAINVYELADGPATAEDNGPEIWRALGRVHLHHTIMIAIRELEKASLAPCVDCATGFCVIATSALTLAIGTYLGDESFHLLYTADQTSLPEYRQRSQDKPASLDQDLSDLFAVHAPEIISKNSSVKIVKPEVEPVPVTKFNVAIVRTLLFALSNEYADDYHLWFQVAAAVYDFDKGPIGLALFKQFSRRNPDKAAKTNFESFWNSLGRGYQGKKITIGSLIYYAKLNGFQLHRSWERRSAT